MTEKNQSGMDIDSTNLEELVEKNRYYALKQLLFANEEQRLAQLELYFLNPDEYAKKIAQVLPESIKQSNSEDLHHALNGLVQECIIESVRNDTQMYTDALYPVILPAIKKSIAEAFKEVMETLNHALEQGLSLNRLAWHIEAVRSGVPYRDVVLKHTLAYQVEQVFLIHRETGLLLCHEAIVGSEQLRDSDAVSAMLTAIQDFINDSFATSHEEQLETVEIGNYTVFLSRGPYAILACVARGISPVSLRERLDDSLMEIHRLYGRQLQNFDGDSSVLEPVKPQLQACLVSEEKPRQKSSPWPLLIILVLLFSFGIYWSYTYIEFRLRAKEYVETLQQQEGIVINEYDYRLNKTLYIKGLYDPLTRHPDTLYPVFLTAKEITRDWQPYQSLTPAFIKRRLLKMLQPPETVSLTIKNNDLSLQGVASEAWLQKIAAMDAVFSVVNKVDKSGLKTYPQYFRDFLQPPPTVQLQYEEAPHYLRLSGRAPFAWVTAAERKIPHIPFLKSYSIAPLQIEEEQQLQRLAQLLQQNILYFKKGEAVLDRQEPVQELAILLKQILTLAKLLNKPVQVVVTGSTDPSGTLPYNQKLAADRAFYIAQFLQAQGIDRRFLRVDIKPAKAGDYRRGGRLQRKAELTLIINQDESQ
jgi:outer membrane protein OmpA-like peptidoglycan-associated protein